MSSFNIHHSKLKVSEILSGCLAALALAAFMFAYFPVWKGLVYSWSSNPESSHGFFIIPLFLYLVWKKREALSRMGLRGSNWGLAIVIFSLLLYIFSNYAEIITLESLSLIPLLSGLIIYFLGFSGVKELIFPVGLLFFMIPVPSQIYSQLTISLQLMVSKIAVAVVASLGVPVFREGNVIHLADCSLQIVRACSGMRSMVSLLALSAVFGYLSLKSHLLRFCLFLSGVPVAIIANIFRVLLIILAIHYLGLDLTKGFPHELLGLLIFVVALLILFAIRGVISPWDKYLAQS